MALLAEKIDTPFVTYNYTALRLVITQGIDSDRMIEALIKSFPTGDKGKRGARKQFSDIDARTMKRLLEKEHMTYREVAVIMGVRRGDNIYQTLKRRGMLPDRGGVGHDGR